MGELRENPQAEIYSQNRRVWETAVMECKQIITQMEDTLIYRRATLEMAERKLKAIMDLESETKTTSKEEEKNIK